MSSSVEPRGGDGVLSSRRNPIVDRYVLKHVINYLASRAALGATRAAADRPLPK